MDIAVNIKLQDMDAIATVPPTLTDTNGSLAYLIRLAQSKYEEC